MNSDGEHPARDARAEFSKNLKEGDKALRILFLASCVVIPICSIVALTPLKEWGIGGLLAWGLIAAGVFLAARMTCPECHDACGLALTRFRFCPECGARGPWASELFSLSPPQCKSCNRALRCSSRVRGRGTRKFRLYKVRYCSNCGTHLHTDGV